MKTDIHCMMENCTMKVVAQGLCIKHYDRWRRGAVEVIKFKGGPFRKVRLAEGRASGPGRKKVVSSASTDRPDSTSIAPGGQVVKRVFERIRSANGGNGDLQKAVDLLVAHGYLSKSKLDAALELVRD